MELKVHVIGKTSVAELKSAGIEIRDVQDALDMIAEAGALGAGSLVIRKENLIPDFFN
jgi:hypothetical protein